MSHARFPMLTVAVVAAAIIAVVAATSGASTKKTPATPPASAVALKQTSLGQTLVDANGRTLYLFQGDRPNVDTLSPAGKAAWPPFMAAVKPAAMNGAVASRIGTIPAGGGKAQVTYAGHPLYYFVGDDGAGQTHGQGLNEFGALWYVLGGSGQAVTSAPSSPAPAAAPMGGGGATGYGY
jgi:predicted lipoprotein with Yx(FWY)xxD motif